MALFEKRVPETADDMNAILRARVVELEQELINRDEKWRDIYRESERQVNELKGQHEQSLRLVDELRLSLAGIDDAHKHAEALKEENDRLIRELNELRVKSDYTQMRNKELTEELASFKKGLFGRYKKKKY